MCSVAVFSKRAVLLLLLTFVLLSVAFRYPLVEHERHHTDSYFIHMLSGSIVDEGYAKWVFHPLSLFGYYPFSYPSGTPFLVAELAELTGVTVDVAILLSGMMLSILFCLAVFFLARHFFSRSEFVLLVTLLVILGPRFIDTTYWDGSARGYAVVMMTLAVAVLLRVSVNVRLRLYPIAAVFVVGCFMVHHMAVLLVLVAIGYLIASVQVRHLLPILGTQGRLFLGASNVFLALLLFVASFFVGIPYGAVGVACAYSVAVLIMMPALIAYAVRGTPVRWQDFFHSLKRPVVATVVMSLAGFVASEMLDTTTSLWARLVMITAAMWSTYLVAIFLLNPKLLGTFVTVLNARRHARAEPFQ